jgi:hypothetical protein
VQDGGDDLMQIGVHHYKPSAFVENLQAMSDKSEGQMFCHTGLLVYTSNLECPYR